jgi:hypothetical protein
VLNRLTAPGSLYHGHRGDHPMLAIALVNAGSQFPLGGTSILILRLKSGSIRSSRSKPLQSVTTRVLR